MESRHVDREAKRESEGDRYVQKERYRESVKGRVRDRKDMGSMRERQRGRVRESDVFSGSDQERDEERESER